MEWLQTLAWLFRGAEKGLIAFIAFVCMLAIWVPLEPGVDARIIEATPDGRQVEK